MVGQLIGWGPALLQLYKAFKGKKFKEATDMVAKGTGVMVEKVINNYGTLNGTGTSLSVTKSLISPLVLFEDTLTHQPYMLDLMTIINMRDIRDALTHINYQGRMGDIEINKLLDSIQPNRTAGLMCLQGCEAYANRGNIPKKSKQQRDKEEKQEADKKKEEDNAKLRQGAAVRGDEFNLSEYVPLALGRTVTASLFVDGKELTFPITFRQIPIPSSTENLELMFKSVIGGSGWNDRINEYRAGGITRPELLTGMDDIKREFKIRNNDLSGYYNEVTRRDLANKVAAVKTGIMSMNALANTVIMTKETSRNIELEIGIRFGSSKMSTIRKHVKANTIIVVDDDRGVFEFYTSSSNIVEKYTASQIKTKVAKENVDSLDSLIKLLNSR